MRFGLGSGTFADLNSDSLSFGYSYSPQVPTTVVSPGGSIGSTIYGGGLSPTYTTSGNRPFAGDMSPSGSSTYNPHNFSASPSPSSSGGSSWIKDNALPLAQLAGDFLGGVMTNATNAGIASNNLDYQREYNNIIWSREDSAVRRRANDLLSAGLSQTLAAGSGAGAGGSSSAPQNSFQYANPISPGSMINYLSQVIGTVNSARMSSAQVNKVLADTTAVNVDNQTRQIGNQLSLIETQKRIDNLIRSGNLSDQQLSNLRAQRKTIDQQLKQLKLDYEINSYDFAYAKSTGLPHQSTGIIMDTVKALLGLSANPDKASAAEKSLKSVLPFISSMFLPDTTSVLNEVLSPDKSHEDRSKLIEGLKASKTQKETIDNFINGTNFF